MEVIAVLDKKIRDAGIPIHGVTDNGDGTYRVDFKEEATAQQRSDAAAIVAGFDDWWEAGQPTRDLLVQQQVDAAAFTDLPEWATYTTAEAVDAIHNAIFAGATLATVNAQIDALPATIAGMRTGLKAVVAEIITERGILEKMAKVVVYLRDRTIAK